MHQASPGWQSGVQGHSFELMFSEDIRLLAKYIPEHSENRIAAEMVNFFILQIYKRTKNMLSFKVIKENGS